MGIYEVIRKVVLETLAKIQIKLKAAEHTIAKSSKIVNSIHITGKLTSNTGDTDDVETLKLYKWSLVPASNADAYREVTVKVISADKIFRTIKMPNAFVVDYHEGYNSAAGMGEFSLVLRQKGDLLDKVEVDGGQPVGEEDISSVAAGY
ncbi:Hypothetical protein LUCI_4163 [Lucifera butyrica]|uniref:Uncharacterized protein n=1 Tax=Lucifera butyrica TaxID=1351585 RepID=A0A498RDG0_9FIRM|nr:membrane-associated protease 1 [Lucifera butyrica]VBB08880.1 Hypothetical protein LUCI_4163 [Lucifera butyrica]